MGLWSAYIETLGQQKLNQLITTNDDFNFILNKLDKYNNSAIIKKLNRQKLNAFITTKDQFNYIFAKLSIDGKENLISALGKQKLNDFVTKKEEFNAFIEQQVKEDGFLSSHLIKNSFKLLQVEKFLTITNELIELYPKLNDEESGIELIKILGSNTLCNLINNYSELEKIAFKWLNQLSVTKILYPLLGYEHLSSLITTTKQFVKISSYIGSIEKDVFFKNFIDAKLNESITDFEHFKRNLIFFEDCLKDKRLSRLCGNLSDYLNKYIEKFTEDKLKNIITNYEQFKEICTLLEFNENKQKNLISQLEDKWQNIITSYEQFEEIYKILASDENKQRNLISKLEDKWQNIITSYEQFKEIYKILASDENKQKNLISQLEGKWQSIITSYEQFKEIYKILAFDENKQHDSIIKLFSVENLFKMVKNIHQFIDVYQFLDCIPTKQAAFINQFKNDNYLALCKNPNDIASLNSFLEANRLRKVDTSHLSNLDIARNESNQNTTSPNAVFHGQELIASHKLFNNTTKQRTK